MDRLAAAAGISKDAFYKFYASKELLVFDLPEDLHTELYQAAAQTLAEDTALPAAERVAEATLAGCRTMQASRLLLLRSTREDSFHSLLRFRSPPDRLPSIFIYKRT